MEPNEVSMLHCFFFGIKFVSDVPNLLKLVFQPCHSVFTFYHQGLCHDCSFCFGSVSRLVHIFEDNFSHVYFLKPCTHEGTSAKLLLNLLPRSSHKPTFSFLYP